MDEYFDEPEFHCCDRLKNQIVTHRSGDVTFYQCKVCGDRWSCVG